MEIPPSICFMGKFDVWIITPAYVESVSMPLLAINKPLYKTSHDVVDIARETLSTRRVGHTGTLDPLATGVLILAVDAGTKLVPFLSSEDKEYLAWVSFGATTPTLDAEGPISETSSKIPTAKEIESSFAHFLQLEEQLPPVFSAIKVGGVKAYEAARSGEPLELSARPVKYHRIELLSLDPRPIAHKIGPSIRGWKLDEKGGQADIPLVLGDYPTAVIRISVASGTYVRSFARDLGELLKSKAFLSGLIRTRVGKISLEDTHTVDDIDRKNALDIVEVLSCPSVELTAQEVKKVVDGVPLPIPAKGMVALVGPNRKLVAMSEGDGFKLKIKRVFKDAK